MEMFLRRTPGEKVSNIILPAIDGSMFELDGLRGKRFMLSFLRFASCPFCNLRVHQLVTQFKEFGEDFTIVTIFDSSLESLQKYTSKHEAPFPILADEKNIYYRKYGIEYSFTGVLKGIVKRMPSMLYAMFSKGYLPLTIKGRIITMPVDFLVDENGIIQTAYYGSDEGDHLPFEKIRAFSLASQNRNANQNSVPNKFSVTNSFTN
jgi:peroxiredoxin